MATITAISSDVLNAVLIPDALRPDIATPLVEARGDQGGKMFDMTLSMNAKAPTTQPVFSTFTAGDIFVPIQANGAGAAAGSPQTITLNAAQITSGAAYVKVGHVVRYNDDTLGIVTAMSSPVSTITIENLVAAENLPAVAANEIITIISHVSATGGRTPSGTVRTYEKDTFQCTIWDGNVQAAGGSEELWWTSTTLGETARTIFELGLWEESIRMAGYMSAMGLYGKTSDTTIADPNSATNGVNGVYKTSEGLLAYAERKGTTDTYNPGFLSLLDFYAADETLIQQFVGNQIMVWTGDKASHEKDQVLGDFLKNTNVVFTQGEKMAEYFGGNAMLAMKFGFNSIIFSERTYSFCSMPLFWHPQFGGAAGYNDRHTMVFIPTSKAETYGGYIPRIRYRYRNYAGNNRLMEIWNTSGSGGNPVNYVLRDDINNHNFRAEGGWEFTAGNQLYTLKAA